MTMYGWGFSRLLVEIMSATGIIIVPFIVLIIKSYQDMHEKGDSGVLSLIRRLEFDVLAMFLVAFFCVMPSNLTSLSGLNLSYTPPTTAVSPTPATASSLNAGSVTGVTGTNYDATFASAFSGSNVSVSDPAAVPIWWYLSMGISSGVSSAFRAGITNNMRDLRMLEELGRMSTIQDPILRNDVQKFYQQCFIPARSQFFATNGDISGFTPAGQAILNNMDKNPPSGTSDVDWIGSHFYRNEPNFYAAMRSKEPIAGVPIDYLRDTDICNPATEEPGACVGKIPMCGAGATAVPCGKPTCNEWWMATGLGMAANSGLRDRLVAHVSTWTGIKNKISILFTANANGYDADDITAKLAFQQANPSYVDVESTLGQSSNRLVDAARSWGDVGGVGRGLTLAIDGYIAGISLAPILMFLTMAQPLILMAIYMFLPTIVIFGSYDLKLMIYGGLIIFTVKFWTVMWFVARWVDDNLIAAMKPGIDGNAIMEFLMSTEGGNTNKRLALNILLLTMYVLLPLIWTSLMAMIGVRIGSGLESMTNAHKSGVALGKSAAQGMGKVAVLALKKGK
ncbi:MAG: conjugal transfer protein TraG N-terminal domain-containing protein [Rhodoferax sp.]|nr:conjugal transfer protein TraG N-terminal domain-containing protein [Rhodoferax sp.]